MSREFISVFPHPAWYRQLSAPHIMEDNDLEQGQSPSARAVHRRGQNTSLAFLPRHGLWA